MTRQIHISIDSWYHCELRTRVGRFASLVLRFALGSFFDPWAAEVHENQVMDGFRIMHMVTGAVLITGEGLGLGLAKLAKFANFGGLVLGCIKTKFCKKICV